MTVQKVVCWNSAGIRSGANSTAMKLAFFDQQFSNGNFAIAAFIETHHKNATDLPVEFKEYEKTHHLIHSPTKNETHGGVLAFISKNYDIITQNEIIPGRLLNIKFSDKSTGKVHNLSIFYGPQWKNMKKDEIIKLIDSFDNIHDISDNNIILGDFNFVENDTDKGKNMDNRDKLIQPIWENFKSGNAIADPFRMQFPKRKLYSFVAPAGKSRGDRIYISEDNVSTISNIKYINTPFKSAHKIMTFNINGERAIGPGYWKMNSSIMDDNIYKAEIEDVYNGITNLQLSDPTKKWHLFHIVVESVTRDHTYRKAQVKKGVKNEILKQLQNLEGTNYDDMTLKQKESFLYYQEKYKDIIYKEIQGHQIRTHGNPRFEINEPDIDFYTKLEKRSRDGNIINELQDEDGNIQSRNEKLLEIAQKYYRKLYTPTKTNKLKQTQLLKNIVRRVNSADRQKLDAPITKEELTRAVSQLHDKKSPGPNGITAEFYKTFWYLIEDMYLDYVNAAKHSCFVEHRNTSVTTIVYKHKGEIYSLDNYRPISLINTDLKILSKVLTNRLKPILPSIIHESQTAVDRRRIDYTIHMLRDLIDFVDKNDGEAAFIFLDQEKAFDRVDHDFLFKTMEAFGIGKGFIKWVQVLYCNASTQIKINGFLTERIPLNRGLRQGCPLSPLLYVIVIELLALQFRNNPNLVGFKIGGEKIISLHYADDAIITITQNQCFKEVIKDLQLYEEATGAKVNYGKTKGLWVGKWKERQDKPMNIKWTNKNINRLGVYLGNDNPAKHTFDEITPKIKKSMDYWKQFCLSSLAKARVIEIFHASRLWYAATFYSVPLKTQKDLQAAFFAYINFPRKTPTISQPEMKKLRLDGGAKLIDIDTKIDTYKVRWLIEITSNEKLSTHLQLMAALLGKQKGGLQGEDFLFTTKHYIDKILKTDSKFYKSALQAFKKLQTKKKMEDIKEEKLFYNPTFKDAKNKVLTINATCENNEAYTYGQIFDEYQKKLNGQPHKTHIANIYLRIKSQDSENRTENQLFDIITETYVPLDECTHKFIYQQLLTLTYKEHHSKRKWEEHFNCDINWKKVWKSIHSPISTEDSKSVVWKQAHLNDYTTYSYNKWHNAQQKCPFCLQIPTNNYHITLECPTTTQLWRDVSHHLHAICSIPVTDMEKVFGIYGHTPNILLRNYITFLLRQCIAEQENAAYYNKKGPDNIKDIKLIYNQKIKSEVWMKYHIYKYLGRLHSFESIFAVDNYLITWENDNWQMLTMFDLDEM